MQNWTLTSTSQSFQKAGQASRLFLSLVVVLIVGELTARARQAAGGIPVARLKARLKAASDS